MNARKLNWYEAPLQALFENDRKPEVKESYAVPSNSRDDLAHVVRKVECLSVPFEDADAVSDKTVLWLCSCEDFQFNRWKRNYEPLPERVENVSGCRHCNELKPVKAQSDENQATLSYNE